jgi:cytochrome c-type biogenesis protein CcmF
MIPEIALLFLICAFSICIFSVARPLLTRLCPNVDLPNNNIMLLCLPIFVFLSFTTLVFLFATNDFSVQYVAHNSSIDLPLIYKFTAIWGAHEGSLLLWVLLLSILGSVSIYITVPKHLQEYANSLFCFICAGFLLLILATSNPFLRFLPLVPTQGGDLNPLLQDPGFVMHPPILYVGYVGFCVPFVFALCSQKLRQNGYNWVDLARPWSLFSWSFLTLGISLGSWWAYYELGWGGWWFWDPVENASFMPWLSACALNHMFMMNAKNNKYETTCVFLAIITFLLCLIGTFLVRSGALTSVHSFAADPTRGLAILLFVSVVIMLSAYYFCKMLPIESKPFRTMQREAGVSMGVILLSTACFTVFLGTLFPLFYEAWWNESISIGIPYFKKTFVPIAGILLLMFILTMYKPKQSPKYVLFVLSSALVCVGFFLLFKSAFYTILALLSLMVCIVSIIDYLKLANLKRIPILFAHFGLGFAALGMVLTSYLSSDHEIILKVHETTKINGYYIQLKDIYPIKGQNYDGLRALFSVTNSREKILLMPEKRHYQPRDMVMTESAIKPGFLKDIYITLGDRITNNSYSVRIHFKPFVRWIWLGGILIAFGGIWRSFQLFSRIKLHE